MAPELEFCLLGPLSVRCRGADVPIPRAKERVLLAALLLNANRVVDVNALAEALWGDAVPPTARVTVRNYVKRLRDALGEAGRDRISTEPPGYCLLALDGELDVQVFEERLVAAREAVRDGLWASAAEQARAALRLWRGEALAGIESGLLTQREVPRLAEMRLQAVDLRFGAAIELGRQAEVIGELRRHVSMHPLREHFHVLLMAALYRDGRQADALEVYQQAYRVLMDALGSEPGAELREWHRRILAGEPAAGLWAVDRAPAAGPERRNGAGPGRMAGPASGPGPEHVTGLPVPRQLPLTVACFTGREAELDALTDLAGLADPGPRGRPRAMVVSAIRGAAGVGKTALAVQWAHRAAGESPTGSCT